MTTLRCRTCKWRWEGPKKVATEIGLKHLRAGKGCKVIDFFHK